MSRSHIEGTTLAAAVLAASFGFTLLAGPFSWIASIAGLVLVFVLFGCDREGVRGLTESLGFAAVVSLALTLAAAKPLLAFSTNKPGNLALAGSIADAWLPVIWVGLTILLWIMDRTRMSARVPYVAAAPVVQTVALSHAVPSAPVVSTPPAAPSAPVEPAPRATFTRPSFTPVEPSPEPAPYEPPQPPPVPEAAPLAHPELSVPESTPATQATPIPAGKEAMIYVGLVGEGLNVLRAVRAEHLGRDFYKIAETMPEGEVWQFGPGQVVRCKKKNLSSGRAMVAFEEAPRAN